MSDMDGFDYLEIVRGEIMQKKKYIGKYVDIEKAEDLNWNIEETFIESPLIDSYSVEIEIKEMKIKDILRVEHCHLCGGQGSDSYINRFPNWLEVAIDAEIKKLICTREHAISVHKSIKDEFDRENQEDLIRVREAEEKKLRDSDPSQCPSVLLRNLAERVTCAKKDEIDLLINSCMQAGVNKNKIINDGLIRGYHNNLSLLHSKAIYAPESMMSLKAYQIGLNLLGGVLPFNEANNNTSVSFICLKYFGRINPLFAHDLHYPALSFYGFLLNEYIHEITFDPLGSDSSFVNNLIHTCKAIDTELTVLCPGFAMNEEMCEKLEVLVVNSGVKTIILADNKYDPLALIEKMSRHLKRPSLLINICN